MIEKDFHSRLSKWGAFLFMVLISVGWATTTQGSRSIIELLRYLVIAGLLATVATTVILGKIKTTQATALSICLILVLYGLLLSTLSGSLSIGSENMVRDVLVVAVGIFVLAGRNGDYFPCAVVGPYVFYVVAGLTLTFLGGGLDLSFPPRFLFEYSSDVFGSQVSYSQGVSKFYGFGAIASLYLAFQEKRRWMATIFLFITATLLSFSILGGARGDAAAISFVIISYIAGKHRFGYLVALTISIFLYYSITTYWDILSETFVFFRRFENVGSGDFGLRDQLAQDAMRLLINEPSCLIFGCGFGYFQYYYGYEFGLYPHNVLLESVIVFGIPIMSVILVCAFGGARTYLKRAGHLDLMFLMMAASLLIDFKSGYIFGNWLTSACLLSLCGSFLGNSFFSRGIDNRSEPSAPM